jgi:hypothetical protein
MKRIFTHNKGVGTTLPHALPFWVHPSHKDHDWL